jgi:hypothetical protein
MPSWNHDGTQDPGPPPVMPDALSGRYDADAVRIRVVEPSMPDITKVREAMASVLDEDSELRMSFDGLDNSATGVLPTPPPVPGTPNPGANDPDAGDGGEGVGPAANPPTPPVGIQLPPAIVESPRRVRRLGGALGIPAQRDRRARPIRRRNSWSPGLAAIGLLLLVIGILVIVMLASLIDTISSIFT